MDQNYQEKIIPVSPLAQKTDTPADSLNQGLFPNSYSNMKSTDFTTPNSIPEIYSSTPIYQNNYQNMNNISEVPTKGIKQINSNTFLISTGCYFLYMLYFILFLAFLAFFGSILTIIYGSPELGTFLGPLAGIIIFIFFCKERAKTYTDIYFILNDNSLKIIKKSCFKKEEIYSYAEINEVKFDFYENYNERSKKIYYDYYLYINLNSADNKKETLFEIKQTSKKRFTQEEINYFLYIVNKHIQTKM